MKDAGRSRPPVADAPPAPPDAAPNPRGAKALVDGFLATYVLLLVLGVLVFRSPGATQRGNQLSWPRAVFAAANALSLSGFPTTLGSPADMKPPAQVMMLLLTVAGALFALTLGGLAVVRILRLPYRDDQILWTAIFCQAVALLAGAIGLYDQRIFYAGPFQAAAALANSGLWLGAPPDLLGWQTHLVLLPLAVLGGLGVPVLLELRDAVVGRKALSVHARTVLWMTGGLYLAGVALLVLLRWLNASRAFDPLLPAQEVDWRLALTTGSVGAVVTRSAGLPINFTALFPATSMQFLAMLLMMIGGSPGGTAGGVKTTTVVELARGVGSVGWGKLPGRSFVLATVWLLVFAVVTAVVLVLLLETEPQMPPHRVLFLAVSAMGCVGLAHDPLAISDAGLFVLSGAVLAGRLLPLAVLWRQARQGGGDDLAVG